MKANRTREAWLADLASADQAVVISALHEACVCTGSAELYEGFMPMLHAFKKDPRPEVRKVALHLEQDSLETLARDDEQAAGYERNRPGGFGRRGQARRTDQRHGFDESRRRT